MSRTTLPLWFVFWPAVDTWRDNMATSIQVGQLCLNTNCLFCDSLAGKNVNMYYWFTFVLLKAAGWPFKCLNIMHIMWENKKFLMQNFPAILYTDQKLGRYDRKICTEVLHFDYSGTNWTLTVVISVHQCCCKDDTAFQECKTNTFMTTI